MTVHMSLHWVDYLIVFLNLAGMAWIGAYFSRKTRSSEQYFLAGRSMPGWVVGISIMSTAISAMTFIAAPAFA